MPLLAAAFAFTVLWTGFMLWWSMPLQKAEIVILLLAGPVAGGAWYWGMRHLPPFRR